MRSKKAAINVASSILYELIKIISAFIIPRLILKSFGSNTNGINQAVTQFISYISLLTAGISSVTTAALYKPLADKDTDEISGIINSTELFLRNISKIFVVALIIFALVFPLFVLEDFNFLFTSTLVIILGIGTFANYYFGLTYRMILNADQKQYINRIIQIVLLITHTVVSVILINNNATIHTVQFVSAIIFSGNPIFVYFFVKRKYKIDKSVTPNYESIDQRWDAFGHQIANFANNNTDLLLLTIFTSLKEVSVYSIYYLVFNGSRMTIISMITGTESAFGNMIAKNEIDSVRRNLKLYEFFIHSVSIILYSSMAILITSFIDLYTSGIQDANYHRPVFGYLISAVGFFMAVRIPYEAITRASGHFKQTRNGAIFEAILNVVLSIILVIPFGMVGLIIGTLVASIFRTLQYGIYASRKLIDRSLLYILKRYLVSVVNIVIIVLIVYFFPLVEINNYYNWIINGLIVTGIGIVVTFLFSLLFYFDDFINMKSFVLRIFKKTKKKSNSIV